MEKKVMIDEIMGELRTKALAENKFFDAGDIFLSLCFKSDSELKIFCKLLNITGVSK